MKTFLAYLAGGPLVANLAAKVLALNPDPGPKELKSIIMDTVDKPLDPTGKPIWEGLVKSGGVINSDRALHLAALVGLLRENKSSISEAATQLQLSSADVSELDGC